MISVVVREGEEIVGVAHFRNDAFYHLPRVGETIKIHHQQLDLLIAGKVTSIHHEAWGYNGKNPIQGDIIIQCEKV